MLVTFCFCAGNKVLNTTSSTCGRGLGGRASQYPKNSMLTILRMRMMRKARNTFAARTTRLSPLVPETCEAHVCLNSSRLETSERGWRGELLPERADAAVERIHNWIKHGVPVK
jgi:hypothetical protein